MALNSQRARRGQNGQGLKLVASAAVSSAPILRARKGRCQTVHKLHRPSIHCRTACEKSTHTQPHRINNAMGSRDIVHAQCMAATLSAFELIRGIIGYFICLMDVGYS